ncbi:ABC transporter ATP-binding protein [Halomarina salina]|uniref:ABC transporter ATP-binding protein n=1 Tax=Halomarina salina TaxID=1872699 RepID=A0ABD5RJ90_9EURY|nr:ABC transporter ATP-binding protein [Halomarina salina]
MPSTFTDSDAVETRALTKRYPSSTAVRELDLSVPEGSVYGFLGPNGAGKTTTMRMLTGLLDPTSGEGHVAGASIRDRRALAGVVGYLPETPPLYDELTGREQLDYVADLRDVGPDADARIDSLVERFDLAGDAGKRIEAYSKGMRQKTAFVQTVLHDPDVVFLDEPTSGLDPRAARTLREEIRNLTDDGTTVFLSTHVLPVVEELADVVGVLSDGRLVAEGTPNGLKNRVESDSDETLEDVFLDVTSGHGGRFGR